MSSNFSNLKSKRYAKKFIEGADKAATGAGSEIAEKPVRLNVEIPASLRQELKKIALNNGITVKQLVLAVLEDRVKMADKAGSES